jgi:hypothetical protein
MSDTKTVYMCGVDFQHHLDGDAYGTRSYPSVEDLKARSKCWPQCGIVECEVKLMRWVAEQDFDAETSDGVALPDGGQKE